MIYNIIPVAFGPLRKITGPMINYQYDVQQILSIKGLELPAYYEVDFCNEGDAETVTVVGTADGVPIPDSFLQTGKKVKAYIVLSGNGVQTRYEITLPVTGRPGRVDIDPTETQQLQIDTLVAAMNSATENSRKSEDRSEANADQAGIYNEYSKSWAVGGTGKRAGEDTDNARYYSMLAAQDASEAGWVKFYIDDDGNLHYVRTENADLSFYIDDNGMLHVTNS